MCKYSNVFSLAVLIGRGLDHIFLVHPLFLLLFLYFIQFSVYKKEQSVKAVECRLNLPYAPLAQLVEHLTLNQGVPGSNP